MHTEVWSAPHLDGACGESSRLVRLLGVLAVLQAMLGLRVAWRLLRTAGGPRIPRVEVPTLVAGQVAAIVPVLNEAARLGPCLAGLAAQEPELGAVLVVDGGSTDDTRE